jgi:monoterpene epsilon-lactone hydrolase
MSLQLYFVNAMLRFMIKRRFQKNPDLMEIRGVMNGTRPTRLPASVRAEQMELGGVATERVAGPDSSAAHAILYIHGGGFVAGAPQMYHALNGRLTKETGVPIYAIDYRLAPEHPFPAGLDDCVAAYRALLDRGLAPGNIAVAGDSAGGNLTLALALKLKALGLPLPAALVALSPVTDIVETTLSREMNGKSDVMFDPRSMATIAKHYCPGHDPRDPFVSPRNGDPAGLPPTLFLASDAELLRDDSMLMVDKMRAAGVDATLELWSDVPHAWLIMADILPEGRAAIAKVAAFIKAKLKL